MSSSLLTQHATATESRCPKCDYALKGITTDRCPECGCQLTLTITTLGNSSKGLSTHLVLWWCLLFHLTGFAGVIWIYWDMFQPIREMMTTLGRPSPNFFSYLWDGLSGSLTELASPVMAFMAAAWLFLQRRLTAAKAARLTPQVCVALLILTLLLQIASAVL